VVRPGDANETSICWRTIIEHTSRPAGIVLSRQNILVLDRGTATGYAAAEGAARGGYILAEAAGGKPAAVLIGTGSEMPGTISRKRAFLPVSSQCHAWNGSPRIAPVVTVYGFDAALA
jgi:transketolase